MIMSLIVNIDPIILAIYFIIMIYHGKVIEGFINYFSLTSGNGLSLTEIHIFFHSC